MSQKTYKTIGEVSEILDLPEYVLRFWETRFNIINPEKINGRRYYNQQDIDNIKKIKHYLYEKGMTIKGTISILSEGSNVENGKSEDNSIKKLLEIKTSLENILEKLH